MATPFPEAATEKCWDRLGKAKRALHMCRNALVGQGFAEFTSQWADFLNHTGGVIHAIESGARMSPQRRQWYGKVARESRADPFLRYFHQARNAEEHGTDRTTAIDGSSFTLDEHGGTYRAQGPGPMIDVSDEGVRLNPGMRRSVEGISPTIAYTPEGPRLKTVTDDRYGDAYPPPTTFGGRSVSARDPVDMGEVYLAYLEELIKECAS